MPPFSTHAVSSYPSEIAKVLAHQWEVKGHDLGLLPDEGSLTTILDVCYQASLLREEDDPVRCRIIFATPDRLMTCLSDRTRPHILAFSEPTTLSAHNLRKLAGAADFYRSLLAVEKEENGRLVIWGMAVTGTEWVNRVEGSRFEGVQLPENLVVQAVRPGHLVAASGHARVLETMQGQLLTDGFDPFRSEWISERFTNVRESLLDELHASSTELPTTRVCESFVRDVAQGVVRRVLRQMRNRRRGGMLVFLPEGSHRDGTTDDWLRFRVAFHPNELTMIYRDLILRLISRALEVGGPINMPELTWNRYQEIRDPELRRFDDYLIEFGHLLADMMSVDGALVLDHSFRMIGFGGEILGDTPVHEIHRALDIEATRSVAERADSAGTRHRSAYRLVNGLNQAIAVVVSQDGDARFVAHQNGKLTYWPYLP
ncbi:putative sensor domain DACNV-containing protein [Rhodopirellula sallentina]|uniref:Probable sensor domain-containing protein n=1 Tax=Rhodopirellula sallentina SM41 TaxID=1263870 RepID=M5TWE7_9BACT|nr:diadenylate cyclase [Rhodopirellula sallentina]EMI53500.1 hypothetical protein RSSM_05054 [Rhodopirellula sallentina SM41]